MIYDIRGMFPGYNNCNSSWKTIDDILVYPEHHIRYQISDSDIICLYARYHNSLDQRALKI